MSRRMLHATMYAVQMIYSGRPVRQVRVPCMFTSIPDTYGAFGAAARSPFRCSDWPQPNAALSPTAPNRPLRTAL
jgi:hypothetical protein